MNTKNPQVIESPRIKSWGVVWHSGLLHSRDYRCTDCGDRTLELDSSFVNKWEKHLVGFDHGEFIGVFKCPRCENLFWFHLNASIIKLFPKCLVQNG